MMSIDILHTIHFIRLKLSSRFINLKFKRLKVNTNFDGDTQTPHIEKSRAAHFEAKKRN